jgi:hypothetical protein
MGRLTNSQLNYPAHQRPAPLPSPPDITLGPTYPGHQASHAGTCQKECKCERLRRVMITWALTEYTCALMVPHLAPVNPVAAQRLVRARDKH